MSVGQCPPPAPRVTAKTLPKPASPEDEGTRGADADAGHLPCYFCAGTSGPWGPRFGAVRASDHLGNRSFPVGLLSGLGDATSGRRGFAPPRAGIRTHGRTRVPPSRAPQLQRHVPTRCVLAPRPPQDSQDKNSPKPCPPSRGFARAPGPRERRRRQGRAGSLCKLNRRPRPRPARPPPRSPPRPRRALTCGRPASRGPLRPPGPRARGRERPRGPAGPAGRRGAVRGERTPAAGGAARPGGSAPSPSERASGAGGAICRRADATTGARAGAGPGRTRERPHRPQCGHPAAPAAPSAPARPRGAGIRATACRRLPPPPPGHTFLSSPPLPGVWPVGGAPSPAPAWPANPGQSRSPRAPGLHVGPGAGRGAPRPPPGAAPRRNPGPGPARWVPAAAGGAAARAPPLSLRHPPAPPSADSRPPRRCREEAPRRRLPAPTCRPCARPRPAEAAGLAPRDLRAAPPSRLRGWVPGARRRSAPPLQPRARAPPPPAPPPARLRASARRAPARAHLSGGQWGSVAAPALSGYRRASCGSRGAGTRPLPSLAFSTAPPARRARTQLGGRLAFPHPQPGAGRVGVSRGPWETELEQASRESGWPGRPREHPWGRGSATQGAREQVAVRMPGTRSPGRLGAGAFVLSPGQQGGWDGFQLRVDGCFQLSPHGRGASAQGPVGQGGRFRARPAWGERTHRLELVAFPARVRALGRARAGRAAKSGDPRIRLTFALRADSGSSRQQPARPRPHLAVGARGPGPAAPRPQLRGTGRPAAGPGGVLSTGTARRPAGGLVRQLQGTIQHQRVPTPAPEPGAGPVFGVGAPRGGRVGAEVPGASPSGGSPLQRGACAARRNCPRRGPPPGNLKARTARAGLLRLLQQSRNGSTGNDEEAGAGLSRG
ncbi:collagen alpha-1(I) chain-like [Dasypus novemcinctus]|uniref:collagen alpha-1(I) chain-like n=1 Tax=Dasypus novemcinctus TaxID=9361 RepID=UPI0039C9B564